ncbi:potassium transporter Kup [Novosphingobium sp. 9]|uniref:potassium transporter Kup n=1 Tax=Novosphingobium sp. 9 TaxID=2025349 RepID=UPI0021B5882E|nr:potassium transporter Kup [Novosphingobium sp. 9]
MHDTSAAQPAEHGTHRESLAALALGAIGVVFGDIGTSPLYALKESFIGHHPMATDVPHLFGVISLMFWTMTLIVTIKYVLIVLRADNQGEGGSLALLALIQRSMGSTKWMPVVIMLGVAATALFYGDAIITPAISVLSAVEGLTIVSPAFGEWVIPIAIVILIALFSIQSHGTATVGRLFGPVILVYFAILAVMGAVSIAQTPQVLAALSPTHAVAFFLADPVLAFLALGSVILAVTGAEALYADMGHFGRRAIMVSWLYVAFPCLILNYLGQAALVMRVPDAISNPFFLLAPDWARLPLVVLATAATVIASQATISGAYSVSQQAVQLGYLPRLKILHTSAKAAGQIYVPLLNWGMLAMVVLLVLGFHSSTNLAAAYGIAVTGTMVVTACMLSVLMFGVWKWHPAIAGGITGLFLLVDGAYFASNVTKIPDGGWFPILIAGIVFTLLTTWATGRRIVRARLAEDSLPIGVFLASTRGKVPRIPGTSVFLASTVEGIPPALLHNLKHNHILHERVVILTVVIEGVPHVPQAGCSEVEDMGDGFYRMVLHYGFMDEADIPAALANENRAGAPFRPAQTSYFLSRQTLIASSRPGMAIWREKLFSWMVRNAQTAMEFFKLPTNRVIELGSQLEI